MSKLRPNIGVVPFNDRQRVKNLVLKVLDDVGVFEHIPDSISLVNGTLFVLTLNNKRFNYEEIKVDIESDYVDVYLQGLKKPYSYKFYREYYSKSNRHSKRGFFSKRKNSE
jgi:hypothetical protein